MPGIDPPPSPFKGLAPFEDTEIDALLFFGRQSDSEVIAANLVASRLTVLHGPLGVGKSSVLRAGVARRLRSLAPGAAVVVHDSWAAEPRRDLTAAVAREVRGDVPRVDTFLADVLAELGTHSGGELYLILDQFEELFAYPHADAFARELAEVVRRDDLRINVLLAVREDALADLDAFTGRIPNVFGNLLSLPRLSFAEARSAITGPIARFNELSGGHADVDDDLVDVVIEEVAAGRVTFAGSVAPGNGARESGVEAPYLQLVMQRLWASEQERGSTTLRRRTLEELGGSEAIVRSHFDEAIDALEAPERDIAARLFNHLVTPSGTKIAHEIDDLAEYSGTRPDDLRGVLESLGRDRIVRPVDGRYEIFHDVLAEPILAWRARYEGERALELERADSARRRRRFLLFLAAALAALLAMAALTTYALTQRSHAREQADVARAQALRANANRVASEAGALIPIAPSRIDPELGLLLGVEAAKRFPSVRAADVLRRALLVSHARAVLPDRRVTTAAFGLDGEEIASGTAGGEAHVYGSGGRSLEASLPVGSPVLTMEINRDGRLALTTEGGGPARIWDVPSGTPLESLGTAPTAASFSPDGAMILTVEPRAARIWRADGSPVSAFRPRYEISHASFAADGVLVAVVGEGRIAQVFRARDGHLVGTFDQGGDVTDAVITPDSTQLVTTGKNKTARVWSLTDGELEHELTGHRGQVIAAAVSRDGRRLVTTSTDETARVWALPDGTLLSDLVGHTNRVLGAEFSADGSSLLTWSLDGTARVWDPEGGATRAVLAGHRDAVMCAEFDRSGERVLTTSADGTARLWASRVEAELSPVASVAPPVSAATFSDDGGVAAVATPSGIQVLDTSDGSRIAGLGVPGAGVVAVSPHGSFVAVGAGGQATIWDLRTAERVARIDGDAPVTALSLDTSARRLAVGTADGTVRVWSREGTSLGTAAAPGAHVTSLDYSPTGSLLAVGYKDGAVAIWSLSPWRLLERRPEHREGTAVQSVAFSAEGSQLVSVGRDAAVHVSNTGTGSGYVLPGHAGTVSDGAFSPDGRWLVTAGPTVAGLWDLLARQRLLFLPGHDGAVLASAFGEDGRRIETIGADGTVRVYRCEVCARVPSLIRLAEERLAATGRTLTASERRAYLDSG